MQSQINPNQFKSKLSLVDQADEDVSCAEFFAGGGGMTEAMENAGMVATWILNHDPVAIKTNKFHHDKVKVFCADIYKTDEHEVTYADWWHGSIECKWHSRANGGKEKKIGSYTMGYELYRYVVHGQPLVLSIENVPEFKKWAPLDENNEPIKSRAGEEFERWKKSIMDLGYEYQETICNAADYGLPTRRVRYFAFFYRPGIDINIPDPTHNEFGTGGKLPWSACRPHIDTNDVGHSMFGREFNMDLRKQSRKPLCPNSQRRIAGGVKKMLPGLSQFLAKYHAGFNVEHTQTLDKPINNIDCNDRHQLVTLENDQFIQDHCRTDNYQSVDEPLRAQLTWQSKQLVNIEKLKFIMDYCRSDKFQDLSEPLGTLTTQESKRLIDVDIENFLTQYYSGSSQYQNLDEPINNIDCNDRHQLVNVDDPLFIAKYYNSGGNPESQIQTLDEPLGTVMTENKHQLVRIEKLQFIAKYFNSNGNPEYNTESLDGPLSPITTEFKHQLITLLDDFDIKVRFLRQDELAGCSTFRRDYFDHPELGLTHKDAIRMIGNAVPPEWGEALVAPNVEAVRVYKRKMREEAA